MKSKLFIDLETIPSQLEWVKNKISDTISPPGNIKKPESIQKWLDENKETAAKDKLHKTGFDGSVGEIICIAYAFDNEPVEVIGRHLNEPEGYMLQKFSDVLTANKFQLDHGQLVENNIQWVGHNVSGFDLRFLWQRMVINKIKPEIKIPFDAKPWNPEVFDTLHEWTGGKSQGFGSLDSLCKIFEIEGKGDIDGSKVWEYVQAERYEEVFEYCKQDVEKTRQLYNFMTLKAA